GAVAGFGIAGPYGAAGGFLLGAGSAVLRPEPGAPPPPKPTLTSYICSGELLDLSHASSKSLSPSISFPLTIHTADARPFRSQDSLLRLPQPKESCWHVLPNSVHLSSPVPVPANRAQARDVASRTPGSGDGWLYRVITEDDPAKPPTGAMITESYFT